jgi:hypothetical protein
MIIQQHEWALWTNDPCTKEFVKELQLTLQDTQYKWSRQDFFDKDDANKSDRLNLYALASVDVLNQVINLIEERHSKGEENV